jgi:hypothetical protein
MRELQDLDPAPDDKGADSDASAISSELEEEIAPRPYRQTEAPGSKATDPVKQAILQVLSQPFYGDPLKGPYTVTTVKVPTAVWERLALYAQLTGEHKQDILAKALRDFLKPGKTRSTV